MNNNIADLELIEWLFSIKTGYNISKVTGIGESTISRWVTGKTPFIKMSLENAIKLTNYAKKLKEEMK